MAINEIRIQSGLISGMPCGNPAYTVFKGIPYAKPPVGEKRWKAPEDPEPWSGVRKCDTFGPISIQKEPTRGEFYQKEFFPVNMPMSEDCLYLNVWMPSCDDGRRYPVMVWIHGGAFLQGYGHEMEFDGEAFCKRGVILVTLNYRLGILGFFAHKKLSEMSPYGASGNYGILDQIHALNWVKNNIEAFGGDPGNVTVFGQSAGGHSVQSIVASPLSKGLFHKVIVQSAGGILTTHREVKLAAAEEIGADICRISGLSIEELMELPGDTLFKTVNAASKRNGYKMMMAPIVDGYLLKDVPGNIIAEGGHCDIPYMIGTVAEDNRIFKPPVQPEKAFIREEWDRVGARLPAREWAWSHLKLGRKPVYTYYFDRDMPGEDHPGAFHSSELWYVFGTLDRCWRPFEPEDHRISKTMTGYWTNFAKAGDPNGEWLPKWPVFTAEQPLTLEINEACIQAKDLGMDPVLKHIEEKTGLRSTSVSATGGENK